MLIPAWQLHLNNQILEKHAVIARFDGKHPSLACATSAGKVLIHNPREHNNDGTPKINFLNINKKITALDAGALNPENKRDNLLIGTQTNLLAFDVENNCDLFYADVPDGVGCITYGMIPGIDVPLALVGGNCCIQGFDSEGNEMFWTVTGDSVTSMALCDPDNDGQNEILVGSDDFVIRIFHLEEVMSECTETHRVTGLTPLRAWKYGFALGNGSIGVYDKDVRLWRVKNKDTVTAIQGFDLDADGVPELISGWDNGRIEVRNESNGELIYKDKFNNSISKILQEDYRMDGRQSIIVCASDGEVRGYLPAEGSEFANDLNSKHEKQALRELMNRKQEMLSQLKSLEDKARMIKAGETSAGEIDANTKVQFRTGISDILRSVVVQIQTNNDSVIKASNIFSFDNTIFDGESIVVYPKSPGSKLKVVLKPPKDEATQLTVQAIVGARGSSEQFVVFEEIINLPKFSMYLQVNLKTIAVPKSSVSFHIDERASRASMWVETAFPIGKIDSKNNLSMAFECLRNGLLVVIEVSSHGDTVIRCDDMETAANMVQDLCTFLQITQLESIAFFPSEMEEFQNILMKVDEFNLIRLKLTGEMADNSNLVKALVIKAEDARIIGDMKLMKRIYSDLFTLNNELIGEYTKRSTNHVELLAALKKVNQMIQKAARLRVGTPKTRIVSACRSAIKNNNISSLFHIIENGSVRSGNISSF